MLCDECAIATCNTVISILQMEKLRPSGSEQAQLVGGLPAVSEPLALIPTLHKPDIVVVVVKQMPT